MVVTSKGGPKYQVRDGINGFVATDAQDFGAKVKRIVTTPSLHRSLRDAACVYRALRFAGWHSAHRSPQPGSPSAGRGSCCLPAVLEINLTFTAL